MFVFTFFRARESHQGIYKNHFWWVCPYVVHFVFLNLLVFFFQFMLFIMGEGSIAILPLWHQIPLCDLSDLHLQERPLQ
jgi:hypothetical protein